MPRTPNPYRLTSDLVAAHAGASGIVCLDASAEGRTHRLYSAKPDASHNRRAVDVLADLVSDGGSLVVRPDAPAETDVLLVSLKGPIESEGGYHDPCGGWTEGHDTIYMRLAAAFEIGDVVLSIDSPGGAVDGGPEMIRRAVEMKRRHGRRCVGHTERTCASMALWWAAGICDEMYTSPDGRVGSVGARGMLVSIAGALAKDGITVEVLEDPEGKAAGVAERPLDPEAIARAQRDVSIAADMFRAAVCGSSWGARAGLTPDVLRSYRGDAYVGQAAVDAGFADGVMTLEGVMNYALATAGTGATMNDDEKDEPKGEDGPEEEAAVCKACKQGKLGAEQRFCGMCGADRVAKAEDEEEAPASSKPKKDEARVARAPIAPSARASATVASLLGLRADASTPAIVTALAGIKGSLDLAADAMGTTRAKDIATAASSLALDVTESKRSAQTAERLDLCKRYAAAVGTRDGYVDDVIVDGKRVDVKPGAMLAHMPLADLRERVAAKEKAATKRTPFDADAKRAKSANEAAKHGEIAAASKDHPAVVAATRAGVPADDAANILAREFGGAS